MSRLFKIYRRDGSEQVLQKGKRYRFKKDGSVVEYNDAADITADLSTDELVFAGSKTDIRTKEINDRNVSVMIKTKADKDNVYTRDAVYTRAEVDALIEQAAANLSTTPDGAPIIDGGTY